MSKKYEDLKREVGDRNIISLHDLNLTNDYKFVRLYNADEFNPLAYIEIILEDNADSTYKSYKITFVNGKDSATVYKRIASVNYVGISIATNSIYILQPNEYYKFLEDRPKSSSLKLAVNEYGFIREHYDSDGLVYFVTKSDNISVSKLYDLTKELREVN